MKHVLGVDPGGHTGLALVDHSGTILSAAVVSGLRDLEKEWSKLAPEAEIVYCEEYTVYGAFTREAMDTIKTIGVIEYLAYRDGLPIQFRLAGSRKGYLWIVEKRLRYFSLPSKTDYPHIRDAYSHALAGMRAGPASDEVEEYLKSL